MSSDNRRERPIFTCSSSPLFRRSLCRKLKLHRWSVYIPLAYMQWVQLFRFLNRWRTMSTLWLLVERLPHDSCWIVLEWFFHQNSSEMVLYPILVDPKMVEFQSTKLKLKSLKVCRKSTTNLTISFFICSCSATPLRIFFKWHGRSLVPCATTVSWSKDFGHKARRETQISTSSHRQHRRQQSIEIV